MSEEIKEISKIDKQLLDKIENILASELSPNEYDIFYDYFNEIRKPNILIDIKDVEIIKNYITNLQKENMKLISENEAIKNIKYTVDETIYKQRNEKAVEYINNDLQISMLPNNQIINGKEVVKRINKIANILQGGDE